jgi:hypothetical protein
MLFFFKEIDNLILRFTWNNKKQLGERIKVVPVPQKKKLKNKKNKGGGTLPGFMFFCKVNQDRVELP